MILYSLICKTGHGFDSWFQNAAAYDALRGAGQLACPVCGAAEIEKSLMAPAVVQGKAGAVAEGPPSGAGPARPSLAEPQSELEAAIAAMRQQIEENSDYVGLNFAAEARRMHDGDAPSRAIYGEARPDEARALIEDGVPVAPLPFLPVRKVN